MTVLNNSKIKLSSSSGVAVYADSSPAPTADLNGREGWLFTKTTGAEKFNYYLWAQGSRALRLRDLRNIFMVASVDTYTSISSVPYIVIYTKPTGVGDAGAFYHSKITHTIDSSQTVMLGEKVQYYTHQQHPDVDYGYRNVSLPIETKTGDALPDEEILYITVHSDSGSADNTQILISDFGFETNHFERITMKVKLDGN